MADFVTGDKQLDRTLKLLGTKIAQKAIAAGVRAGLSELRRNMRRAEPNPRVRKVIATRFKRKKKFGVVDAKVGAGVGKHNTGKQTVRGRPGVGISKQNAHWYFLGTGPRQTKSGASRGRMPRVSDAVKRGAAAGRTQSIIALRKKVREVIDKELRKVNRKGR